MAFVSHLFLIFWKNVYMIQIRRHYFVTLIEIVVPVLIAYVIGYGGIISHTHKVLTHVKIPPPRGRSIELVVGLGLQLPYNSEYSIVMPQNFDEPRNTSGMPENIVRQRLSSTPAPSTTLLPKAIEQAAKNPVRHTLGSLPSVISLLFMLPVFVKRLSDDLSCGAKELMSINGLSETAYWTGNFVGVFFEMFLVQTPVIVLFKFNPVTGAEGLWVKTDYLVLIVFFTVYAASASCFSMIIAIISPRPNIGMVLTFLIMVITLIAPMVILTVTGASLRDAYLPSKTAYVAHLGTCLLPNIGFAYGLTIICESEELGVGITWDNFTTHESFYKLTLGKVCLALAISCFTSVSAAWYLKNVWPFGYSFPKPWWFIVMPSYWGLFAGVGITAEDAKMIREDPQLFEPVPHTLESAIVIYRLSKHFGPIMCRTTILHDVTFKIFQGHITALLGRNGAGKSTLLRIITGSIKPAEGTAFVEGMDIRKQKTAVRKVIGYCPQHAALYREMTVQENLWLFGRVRGMTNSATEDALSLLVLSFQMGEYEKTLVKRLNAGQKRKLQLGIALIGDPKMLLLDEPTVGCDTDTRNALWHSILKIRGARGILLATNCIEEADILGDRSAIISGGVVRCCGSALFLRKKYGYGYRLTMTISEIANVKHITVFVVKIVPTASVFLERNRFIVFTLGNVDHEHMISLLSALEEHRRTLGIFTMGLAATSLEDVLLKVDEFEEGAMLGDSSEASSSDNVEKQTNMQQSAMQSSMEGKDKDKGGKEEAYDRNDLIPLSGVPLFFLQFKSQLNKKMSYYKRSYVALPTLIFFVFIITVIRCLAITFIPFETVKGLSVETLPVRAASPDNTSARKMSGSKDTMAAEIDGVMRDLRVVASALDRMVEVRKIDVDWLKENVVSPLFTVTLMARILDALLIPLSLSLMAAVYVILPIEEEFSKVKKVQLMTGISSSRYWIFNYFIDYITYNVLIVISFLPIYIADPREMTGRDTRVLSRYFMLFSMFGFAFLPVDYFVSFWVETSTVAYFSLIVQAFLTGTMTSMILFFVAPNFVSKMVKEKKTIQRFYNKLSVPFRLIPNFAISRGFGNINRNLHAQLICCNLPIAVLEMICNYFTGGYSKNWLTTQDIEFWDVMYDACPDACTRLEDRRKDLACEISRVSSEEVTSDYNWDLMVMAFSGLCVLSVVIFLDAKMPSKVKSQELMSRAELKAKRAMQNLTDPSVLEERDRVEDLVNAMVQGEEEGLLGILVHKLGKTVKDVHILGQLSFTIQPGETFGILGLQQSGRSSVLSILAGDRELGRGNAYIEGWGIRRHPTQYLRRVGYCPEEDPIITRLSGREMLTLIGRLRGIPYDTLQKEIRYVGNQVGLTKIIHNLTADYGSGSRRKLALGMSLMGDPPVVILHECTQGVDPASRGRLFRAITRIQRSNGMSVLFTSHCMRECDHLCSRVGIVSDGDFTRVGDTVTLKQTATQGCTIIVKLTVKQSIQEGSIKNLNRGIKREFPNSAIYEKREDQMRYRLKPSSDYPLVWSEVFRKLHLLQQEIKFEDFLVNDTSLGEVFIGFARERKMVDFGEDNICYFDKDEPSKDVKKSATLKELL
ncbi:phospholipid-transporting ATPase ABCA3-like [Ornithodoros turicata]|uniref:phospholipid-transporting ATPase ABCA3-like n=1 Tax=Ornithodoros turicata TaxID=34597 RepID=UPI003139F446